MRTGLKGYYAGYFIVVDVTVEYRPLLIQKPETEVSGCPEAERQDAPPLLTDEKVKRSQNTNFKDNCNVRGLLENACDGSPKIALVGIKKL